MKYRELTPSEIEAYDIGYKVGNRKIVITDIEWESENEHKIYRKGYMAGLMDYKRNVNNVSKVNNVEIETSTTSMTSTTPIGISISNGNKVKDKFNEDSIIYVNGQYFDEFPSESISLLKKHWSADEIENMRKELTCKPDHQTTVAQLLLEYPPKPKKKQVEVVNYGEYEYLHSQMDKWIDYKKSRGERYKTEQSLMVCAKKLHELSGGSASVADQIIEQSIANNWAGIFALKQSNNQPKKKNWSNYTGEGSFLKDAKDDPFMADIYNKKD